MSADDDEPAGGEPTGGQAAPPAGGTADGGTTDGEALDGGALDGGALDGGALDGGALDGGDAMAPPTYSLDDDAHAAPPRRIDPGAPGPEVTPDRRRKAVLGVPIEVVVAVGKARPMLTELVGLRRDSVLPLDSRIEDPVEIMIGDRVIARGELQEIDGEGGRLGVRLTEVADLSQAV